MREFFTSGSVGGGGSNPPSYPEDGIGNADPLTLGGLSLRMKNDIPGLEQQE